MCNCPISRPISRHGREVVDRWRSGRRAPAYGNTRSRAVPRVSYSHFLARTLPVLNPEQPAVSLLRASVPNGWLHQCLGRENPHYVRSGGYANGKRGYTIATTKRFEPKHRVRWICERNYELRTVQSTGPSSPYSFLSHSLAALK